MQFVLLQPGNRVRLTEKFVANHGAPWSTGVVIGYGMRYAEESGAGSSYAERRDDE